MWLTKVMNFVRTNEPIIKKHSNEFTAISVPQGDKSWNRRKVKMMTAHEYGRQRNCYKLAVRRLEHNLKFATRKREHFRQDFTDLSEQRIHSAAAEIHYNSLSMRETLARLHIGLNRKVLANLAIWEPRSFRSIVAVCAHKEAQPEETGGLNKAKSGPETPVISRGHL